ncbi:MAG: PQQ-binding-like beta-propeller repeat protein [Acidobacteria bacterium]|nr:PQQ-binding-like beta-propeller repeat protein [Acidobacteriota bacterium]
MRKRGFVLLISMFLWFAPTLAQNNWMYFGQDPGAMKYSTLSQINTGNVRNLVRAWTFNTGDKSGFFESTPLVIDNVLYFCAQNGFYALDAVTGQQIWKYEATGTTRRGVSYWPGDSKSVPRIVASTSNMMVALNAKTGLPVPEFGKGGFVDMGTNMESPPALYKDLLITPSRTPVVRAWSARTGELIWTFNLVAQPGDPGHETWENDVWKTIGGTNVWGYLTVDAERGIAYAPVSIAGSDYIGIPRPGDNLYGTSLVAIDINTGKLKWYQQLVHHDIWDYDLAAAPTLFNVVKDGRTIPAVAQINKMGLLFIFDRTNGTPIFGIEERPVPQSEVPGEKTSPTQPFPVKPAPLARNSMKKEELANNITPEHTAYCAALWEKYKLLDTVPYTPWDMRRDVVVFPGAIGGGNWQGVTFSPKLGLMFTNVMNAGQWGHIEEVAAGEIRQRGGRGGRGGAGGNEIQGPGQRGARGGRSGNPEADDSAAQQPSGPTYRKVTPEGGRFWDPNTRYSCQAPPWGELVAVNTNTGDIAWKVPLGIFEELEARGIKTGTPSLGGAISTAGDLVFIGATIDSRFRAFDARNGRELWSVKLEAPAHSIPSTYMGRDGKQYVVVTAGGGGFLRSPTSDAVVAFRLP